MSATEQSNALAIADAAVERIKVAKQADYVVIGTELATIKAALGHGNWLPYVTSKLTSMSKRTAQNYLRAAEFLADDKRNAIALLPAALVYRLAGGKAPPAIVDAVVAAAEAGDPLDATDIRARLDAVAGTAEKRADKEQADHREARRAARVLVERVGAEGARDLMALLGGVSVPALLGLFRDGDALMSAEAIQQRFGEGAPDDDAAPEGGDAALAEPEPEPAKPGHFVPALLAPGKKRKPFDFELDGRLGGLTEALRSTNAHNLWLGLNSAVTWATREGTKADLDRLRGMVADTPWPASSRYAEMAASLNADIDAGLARLAGATAPAAEAA
jgi:hypothetical protein